MTASTARKRRDFVLLLSLAIGVMAAYLAIQRGSVDSWDGRAMASVAQNLLKHGSLKECCNAFGAFPADKGSYAKYGIGYSLVLTPLWKLQLHFDPNGGTWLGLANATVLAATTVVIAKTGLVLGWRRSSAVLAALAFALLTMAPLYSTEFFADPGVTFASALLVLGLVVWQERAGSGALLIGIGTAIGMLFRPDSMILLAPVVPLMLLFRSRSDIVATWRSWLPRVGVPIGLVLAWTLFYDSLRYGDPFQVGYSGYYDRRGFSTPLVKGVALLLWSPGKSFFVYSPILLVALPGLVLLARRRPPLAVVVATMFVLRVLFYARWWTPEGGNSWGPRFLLPLCAVLAIPLGEVFEHLHELRDQTRRVAIAIVAALAATSVVVQLSSVLVSYRDVFSAIFDTKSLPANLVRPALHQREHRLIWSFGGNHIAWNLSHIGSSDVHLPLYWFQGGATVFGVVMLVLAAVMCPGALALASLSDRIEKRQGARRDVVQ